MFKRLLASAALIASLLVPSFLLTATPADAASASANTVLVGETGRSVRPADYRGKVVFVNFWGSWCTPCIQEMASIRRLQAALRDRRSDVVFMFVSTRAQDFQKDSAWLRQN